MAERKRMNQMKRLCLQLSSLMDESSQEDPFEQVATYINNLEERVDMLRQKRDSEKSGFVITREAGNEIVGNELPVVKMWQNGIGQVDIVVISSGKRALRFYEVIGLLEREGLDIIEANHSTVGDTIIHAIRTEADPEIDCCELLMDKLKALAE